MLSLRRLYIFQWGCGGAGQEIFREEVWVVQINVGIISMQIVVNLWDQMIEIFRKKRQLNYGVLNFFSVRDYGYKKELERRLGKEWF